MVQKSYTRETCPEISFRGKSRKDNDDESLKENNQDVDYNFTLLIWSLRCQIVGTPVKKTKKICAEILERFGDGEYLRHICTGKGEYPDQATFWRWRQKDADLAEQFMSSLIKNVSALLEKSELLIEDATTRDEILRADKMLNHYRWKAEKLIPSMQSMNKSLVEIQGAVGSYTVSWAEDAVAQSRHQIEAENYTHKTASLAREKLVN